MKSAFSTAWKSSKQPRKQRKYRFNAPLHTKTKFLNVHLSAELRKKYSTRAARIRKEDKVQVITGQHKKKSGKVDRVSIKYEKIYITGIETAKRDGTKGLYPFEPSNLMITELYADDKRRNKSLERNVKNG